MQRDFVDSGGFGELLGNDVAPLREVIAPIGRVLAAWRARGLLAIHTREGHRPDLSDCPPAKLARGKLEIGIGDQGPLGRVLVRGEWGHDIVDELRPLPNEPVIDKPGKGSFYATDLELILRRRGITHLVLTGITTERYFSFFLCVVWAVAARGDRPNDAHLNVKALIRSVRRVANQLIAAARRQGNCLFIPHPLPIAGLMSDQPAMALSFLALSVIPELKMTDKGLVDVARFQIMPVFEA